MNALPLLLLAALVSAAPARKPDPKSGEPYLSFQREVMDASSRAKEERSEAAKERKRAESAFQKATKAIEKAAKAGDSKAGEEARAALDEAAAARRKAEERIARLDVRIGHIESALAALGRDPRIAAGAVLLSVSGEVRLRSIAGAEWVKLTEESPPVFEPGSRLEAGKEGAAELTVPAVGVRVRLEAGASYTLREFQRGKVLATLLRGKATVFPQASKELRYAIQTPYAVAMGQEAEFFLLVDHRTGLEAVVTKGSVIIADLKGRDSVTVPAGRMVKVSIRGQFGPVEPVDSAPEGSK